MFRNNRTLVLAAIFLVVTSDAFVPTHHINKLFGTAFLRRSTTATKTATVPNTPINYVNSDRHHEEKTHNTDTTTAAAATTTKSNYDTTDAVIRAKSKLFKEPKLNHNVCPQTGITLSRYMMEMEQLNPELEEVESIFTSIQVGCKAISKLVRNADLHHNTGLAGGGGSINVQGEEQKKMDVLANECLKNALQWAGQFQTIASEEEEVPTSGRRQYTGISPNEALVDSTKKYIAVFDPLDGSSNVDAGIPTGTIFGIFKHSEECTVDREDICMEDVLQPGAALVAAGYCLYSSATTLVFTIGDGTHGFTLDESIGEFVLTHPNMKIPERGSIYSINEGNRWDWDPPMVDYITDLQQGKGETGTKYSARYIGSMVGDVHRTLQYGGIFAYPADKKNVNGKLRLLYEAAPMAYLIEQAGGLATTGDRDIMDVLPTGIHARVPFVCGSRDDVKELQSYFEHAKDIQDPFDDIEDAPYA